MNKQGLLRDIECSSSKDEYSNWQIINYGFIDMAPEAFGRINPVVVPIGTVQVLILGGEDEFSKKQDKSDVMIFNTHEKQMKCEVKDL